MNQGDLQNAADQVATLKWIVIAGGSLLIGAIGAMARYIQSQNESTQSKLLEVIKDTTASIQKANDFMAGIKAGCPCARLTQVPADNQNKQ